MRKTILIFSCCAFFALAAMAQRTEALLEKNWKFTKEMFPKQHKQISTTVSGKQ